MARIALETPPVAAPGTSQHHEIASAPPPKVLRFLRSERWLHWSIAIPFVVCFVTALILVIFYNPHPQRHFRMVFSWIHRISGICLALMPPLVLLTHRREYKTHLRNIKQGWVWALDDFKWLFLMGPAALSKKISLPEQGKFNAAEKLNFMMVMSTWPMFLATGAILFTPGIHVVSWVAHVAMALIATPLMLGHIFMATVNPSTRLGLEGMISGYVDRHWARHHYRRWYREQFEPGVTDPRKLKAAAKKAAREAKVVRCPSCSRPAEPWGHFGVLGLQAATCPSCGAEVPQPGR